MVSGRYKPGARTQANGWIGKSGWNKTTKKELDDRAKAARHAATRAQIQHMELIAEDRECKCQRADAPTSLPLLYFNKCQVPRVSAYRFPFPLYLYV